MTINNRVVLLSALLLMATACSQKSSGQAKVSASATTSARTPAPKSASVATKAPDPAKPAATTVSYDGVFTNGDGATLTLSSFVAKKGFKFSLKIVSKDDCNGVAYKGAAAFNGENLAKSKGDDSFKFHKGSIHMEPSIDMIGMGCARVLHVEFARKK